LRIVAQGGQPTYRHPLLGRVIERYNLQSRLGILRIEDLTIEEEYWLGVLVAEIIREEAEEARRRRER